MDVSSTGCAHDDRLRRTFGKVTANTMETGAWSAASTAARSRRATTRARLRCRTLSALPAVWSVPPRKALTLTESYNTGAVANTANGFGSYTAGLIGEMQSKLTLKAAYNTGAISGAKTNASGLFGTLSEVGANSTVASCYNAGTVTSSYSAAAIAGL